MKLLAWLAPQHGEKWLRLVRAIELYAGRSSITEAAHGAGFADSAHLSRTFRRMFGIAADPLRLS